MATKNIEININNGNGYDILYPKTVVANIGDLSSNYYNKTEIGANYYKKTEIYTKTEVDNLLKGVSGEQVIYGTYSPTDTEVVIPITRQNPKLLLLSIDQFVELTTDGARIGGTVVVDLTYDERTARYKRWVPYIGQYGSSSSTIALAAEAMNVSKELTSVTIRRGGSKNIMYIDSGSLKKVNNVYESPFFTTGEWINYALIY